MSHRHYRDSHAVDWDVWEVVPTLREQFLLDRRSNVRQPTEEPRTSEFPLPRAGMSKGWLLFESVHEKRRLVPIPAGWEELSTRQLEELCHRAAPVEHGDSPVKS